MGRALEAKRRRRAAYVLPTLFTSANVFLGFVAILQSFEGAMAVQSGDRGFNAHFSLAAKLLGFAVFCDGLDGFIARITNTVSDFGRELDSLADVITFGMAPALLGFVWGVMFVMAPGQDEFLSHLSRAGYVVSFFYLLCGAVRLARFNVQTNPMPKNPGRPDRKYFVGMPIPGGAGFIAAIVYFSASPVQNLMFSIMWLILMVIASLLMVSSWRYPSFKQINVSKPRATISVLTIGIMAVLIVFWSQSVLLLMAVTYLGSGIVLRAGGLVRRLRRTRTSTPVPETQIG